MSGKGKVAMIAGTGTGADSGTGTGRACALAMLCKEHGAANPVLGRPPPEPAALR